MKYFAVKTVISAALINSSPFVILLIALAVNGFGQAKSSANSDEAQIREIKIVLWAKAYRNQDTALLDRILHQKFRSIDDEGIVSTKQEEIEYIRNNKPSYHAFRFEIERLEIFDGKFAVVSGTGIIETDGKNGRTETRYRSSNHLIKEDGRWQAISSHVSGVKTALQND